MNILLIEDDKKISRALDYALKSEGYNVTACYDCEGAYAAAGGEYGLMIIDITLPDGNGFELYSQLRKYTSTPVIFLTARDDEDSIVKGFELGGEDYITKPFSTRELLARIGRFKRKYDKSTIIRIGTTELDTEAHTVKKNGRPIELTALEYRIFSMLMQNSGNVVTRETILERIWDLAGNYVNDNTLTVYIRRIRAKLGDDTVTYSPTYRGGGFSLKYGNPYSINELSPCVPRL